MSVRIVGIRALMAAVALGMTLTPGAKAATVTVGDPLTASFGTVMLSAADTISDSSLPYPGANIDSPVSGIIVRWRILGAVGGPFKLRVLTPNTDGTYTGAGTSLPETPPSASLQTFTTSMPISAGQTIGLDNANPPTQIGYAMVSGASTSYWNEGLADGQMRSPDSVGPGDEYAFDAVVQPYPVVASVTPSSGTTAGGTTVTITGQNFTGATSVSFGGVPAQSFTITSDGSLTAVSPAHAAGPVDVVVSNPGQSAIVAADRFTYANPAVVKCVVPKLKGKRLRAAKKALSNANCKLGKVKHRGHGRHKVKKQKPSPGTMLAAGSKVGVTLGK